MKGEITRSQLVDLLKTLVEEQRTGTVYVHTDDKYDNGQISDYHWVQDVICKVLAD